jgi:TolB protein
MLLILSLTSCESLTDPTTDAMELALSPTNVSVYSGSDGAIDLTVSGGTPPYQYLWSNGAVTEDIDNLTFGMYSVNVTDDEDQTKSDSIEITQPAPLLAYCYQPMQNGFQQIYVINSDGTGNRKIVEASIGLNHHDWSPDGQQLACTGYVSNNTWSIYIFNYNGTGLTRLTDRIYVYDSEPAWSPDGSQIAFTRIFIAENFRQEIWVMDADGSNQLSIGVDGFAAKWSPDGAKFIYTPTGDIATTGLDGSDIRTCNIDGTDIQQLTSTTGDEWYPSWSPDGNQVLFEYTSDGTSVNREIYIMNSDGTGRQQLTNNSSSDGTPRWSPDGSSISFASDRHARYAPEIYIMNTDGSDVRRLTQSPSGVTAINAVWQPLPGNNN